MSVALEHAPATQVLPLVQVMPQSPQLLLLDMTSVQVPLQSLVPLGQAHVPLWQVLPLVQVTPQAPQLLLLLETSMHTLLQRS